MKHWYICVVQSCTFPHLRAAYLVSLFLLRFSSQKNRPNRPSGLERNLQSLRCQWRWLPYRHGAARWYRQGWDGDGWAWMQWMEMGDHVETSQFGEFRIPKKSQSTREEWFCEIRLGWFMIHDCDVQDESMSDRSSSSMMPDSFVGSWGCARQ